MNRLMLLVVALVGANALAGCTPAPPDASGLGAGPGPGPGPSACIEPDERPDPGDVVCFSGNLDDPLEIEVGGTATEPVYYRGNGAVVPGIRVEADNVVVEGFVSRGADSTGIVSSGENNTIRTNEITEVYYDGEDLDAIRFFGDRTRILNNWVHDLEGSEDIEDSHVDCIQTFATSGPGSSQVVIQGNRCEGIRAQCIIAEGPGDEGGSGKGVSRNWLIEGNYCDSHADAQSVVLEDIQDVLIAENVMAGTGNKAFALGEGTTGVVVRDNTIGPGYGRAVGFDHPSARQGYWGPPGDS